LRGHQTELHKIIPLQPSSYPGLANTLGLEVIWTPRTYRKSPSLRRYDWNTTGYNTVCCASDESAWALSNNQLDQKMPPARLKYIFSTPGPVEDGCFISTSVDLNDPFKQLQPAYNWQLALWQTNIAMEKHHSK